jgi:CBS domain-containing protein
MPDRPILEIMHAVLSIHPDASVEEAVQKMSSQGMEAILIKQEKEYTGIFTKIDLINLLEKNIRQYAVTQNGKIAGLISIKDLDS